MRHGYHYGPCKSDHGGGLVPSLLLVGVIAAVVFWPTVAAVAATVALIVKVTLIALAAVAVLGLAVAIGVAVRRHRRSEPTAAVLAVRPARRSAADQLVAEQLADLTAAVERLADRRQAALPASAQAVVIDQQTLAALLAGLSRLAAHDGHGRRELAGRRDG